jgi:hypothetical protein
MKERPTSVTVFAIINLILAALGVIGFIFWVIGLLGLMPKAPQENIIAQAMENSAAFQTFGHIANAIGVVVLILLIAASIGMFTLKPWARQVTIAWGVYSILIVVVSYVLSYVLIYGPLLPNAAGQDRVIIMAALIGGGVFSLLFIGYYLLMIFMLTRPKVVDAFTPDELDNDQGRWDPLPGGADQ